MFREKILSERTVQLNCNAGEVFGHYGFRDIGSILGGTWTVTGYPGDKVDDSGYSMWQDSGALNTIHPNRIYYSMDTAGGQSGGPLWRLESGTSCGNCVIGIHTLGHGVSNSATRINATVAAAFKQYAAA